MDHRARGRPATDSNFRARRGNEVPSGSNNTVAKGASNSAVEKGAKSRASSPMNRLARLQMMHPAIMTCSVRSS